MSKVGKQKRSERAPLEGGARDGVVITEGAKLKGSLEWALHELQIGRSLPKYLVKALLDFDSASYRERRDCLLAGLVLRYHYEQGFPLANTSRRTSAFEKAAADVGVSPSTAQRAYEGAPYFLPPENGQNDIED